MKGRRTKFAQGLKTCETQLLLCVLCDGDDGANDGRRDRAIRVGQGEEQPNEAQGLLLFDFKLVVPGE